MHKRTQVHMGAIQYRGPSRQSNLGDGCLALNLGGSPGYDVTLDPSWLPESSEETTDWRRVKMLETETPGEFWLQENRVGKIRAVKQISRQQPGAQRDLEREKEALILLSEFEKHFQNFYEMYQDEHHLFIAKEYTARGSLREFMQQPVTESEAKAITRQILEGLEILHSHNICHRDIKPQNILVSSISPLHVKIANLNTSAPSRSTIIRTPHATNGYHPPEALGIFRPRRKKNSSSSAVDIWSLGCLLHEILSSHIPFAWDPANSYIEDDDMEDDFLSDVTEPFRFREEEFLDNNRHEQLDIGLLVQYCQGLINFPRDSLQQATVSERGVQFLEMLLVPEPELRPTAKAALGSVWIQA